VQELAKLSGSFLLLFGLSVGIAFALGLAVRALRRTPRPLPNGQLRIRSGASVYRARFLGETAQGWTFSAPLQRNAYVPLRVGEPLIIEAPSERGLLRFRTMLIDRCHDSATMVAQRPAQVHVEERRANRRLYDLKDAAVTVEGHRAELINISACGACVSLAHGLQPGERIRVDLPWREEPCFAWVLDAERSLGKAVARLRFEEEVEIPAP
jgi:hypothetical protein